ncbi:MAG: hypothetical protein U9N77_05825 [Thermodesulfobacteriota bacterium]|nr:hypothetical protein [Thermodesulfobacteriota bacterium]
MITNKFTLFGLISAVSGLLLLGYQGLCYFMDMNNQWSEIYLGQLGNYYLYEFSDHIPFEIMQNGCEFLINDLPFYQLLVALGLILILIGAFIKK